MALLPYAYNGYELDGWYYRLLHACPQAEGDRRSKLSSKYTVVDICMATEWQFGLQRSEENQEKSLDIQTTSTDWVSFSTRIKTPGQV